MRALHPAQTKIKTRRPTGRAAKFLQMPTPAGQADMPQIPFDAVMSFIKQTRGALTWSSRDMSDVLKINQEESRQILAVLALQGYVKQAAEGGWMTTIAGESISGSRPPRFSAERIGDALSALRSRIKSNNMDRTASFRVTEAVAFGDFLLKQSLAQAVDVGIAVARNSKGRISDAAEISFLRSLRGRHPSLHLMPYQPWMSARSHQRLI